MDIPQILSGNQFELISTKDQNIFSNAVDRAFQIEFGTDLGEHVSDLISDNVGQSWEKILFNYSLFEDSLKQIFRDGATQILREIKIQIINSMPDPDLSEQSIRGILEYIRLREVFGILKNLNSNQHPILLFTNEKFRDKIIREFFLTNIPNDSKGCFSESLKFSENKTITYDQIVTGNKINTVKINKFLKDVHKENKTDLPSRFACENSIWFKEQGLFKQHLDLDSSLDNQVLTQSCILCCYDLKKLEDSQISQIIQTNGLVIIENPISIFKRKIYEQK